MYTGLGDARPVTNTVGSGLVTAGAIVALIPGGQIPGAIIAAVGALTTLIGGLFKPDLTKIEATHIVDQIEAQVLKPMIQGWERLPPEQKTPQAQAAALAVFDQAWAGVTQGCGNPQLGTAGQNCISDRASTGCHYTTDGQTPGVPPNCGNWFVWYRDPIANDPAVGTGATSNPISSALGGSIAGFPLPLLLIGGLALLAAVD